MFLEISKAKYIADYKVELTFNNGDVLCVDLEHELKGPVFILLKSPEYFRSFKIVYNTIQWENGADFAPEYLYELGKCQQQLASEPDADYNHFNV